MASPAIQTTISSHQVISLNNSANLNSQSLTVLGDKTMPTPSPHGGATISYDDNSLVPSYSIAEEKEQIFDFGKESSGAISVYIVREGDTLSEIAEMFEVSQNTIIWANDLRNKTIRIGEQLIILPITGIQYTIKKGDTISSITKKFGGDQEEILAYNNISAEALAVGETIVIPNGELHTAQSNNKTNSKTKSYSNTRQASKGNSQTVWVNGIKYTPLRGTNAPTYENYYTRPISGYRKSRGLHGYNAVDFAAPRGTPIVAAADGNVIISKKSGWNGGYGVYVSVKHGNGTQTLYAHMSKNIVYSGQTVVAGQVIGYVGSSGNSTGNHLHFEIRGGKNPF